MKEVVKKKKQKPVVEKPKAVARFSRSDPRRFLQALYAIHALQDKATMKNIANELGCTVGDAAFALERAQMLFQTEIDRTNHVYSIKSWGQAKPQK